MPRLLYRLYCSFSHSVMSGSLATPQTVASQAPLSMGFPRQEYWSGLPFPSPGVLLNPGIEPMSPALQEDSLLLSHLGRNIPLLEKWYEKQSYPFISGYSIYRNKIKMLINAQKLSTFGILLFLRDGRGMIRGKTHRGFHYICSISFLNFQVGARICFIIVSPFYVFIFPLCFSNNNIRCLYCSSSQSL